jgi:hypothetical protein
VLGHVNEVVEAVGAEEDEDEAEQDAEDEVEVFHGCSFRVWGTARKSRSFGFASG